jgi:hypothetical protein
MLVYYETHPTMEAAIRRERQIKEWRRLWKIRLIESMNPEWIDLFDEATGEILDGPADVARRTRRAVELVEMCMGPGLVPLVPCRALAAPGGMTKREDNLRSYRRQLQGGSSIENGAVHSSPIESALRRYEWTGSTYL